MEVSSKSSHRKYDVRAAYSRKVAFPSYVMSSRKYLFHKSDTVGMLSSEHLQHSLELVNLPWKILKDVCVVLVCCGLMDEDK